MFLNGVMIIMVNTSRTLNQVLRDQIRELGAYCEEVQLGGNHRGVECLPDMANALEKEMNTLALGWRVIKSELIIKILNIRRRCHIVAPLRVFIRFESGKNRLEKNLCKIYESVPATFKKQDYPCPAIYLAISSFKSRTFSSQ